MAGSLPYSVCSWRRDERGQMLVLTAVSTVALFGVMALAVDIGYFRHQQRRMQTAADAAAIAGATQIRYGNVVAEARRHAASLGFTHGVANATVTVNHPPRSGPYSGSMQHVEAIVAQPQPTYFAHVFLQNSENVTARAVAETSGRLSRNCVYALHASRNSAMHIEPGNRLNADCGIVINSNSPTALTARGLLDAPTVAVSGGWTGRSTGMVRTGTVPVDDPLKYLAPPPVGPCTQRNFAMSAGTATLNPGVYCNGLTLSGTANVTLNPGTYVIAGGPSGSLSVGGNARLTGNGVTVYNTRLPGYPYQPINFQDEALVTLSAPTTGDLAGILFFQDRAIVSNAENVVGGAGGGSLTGALYFPTTPLAWANRYADSAYTIVVAQSISVTVNVVTINNNFSGLPGGSPIKSTVLVE